MAGVVASSVLVLVSRTWVLSNWNVALAILFPPKPVPSVRRLLVRYIEREIEEEWQHVLDSTIVRGINAVVSFKSRNTLFRQPFVEEEKRAKV